MEHTYLDCLAKLGVGGAHPGGLQLTRQLLEEEDIHAEMSILDVGCGTGQTASYIAQNYPCCVIAVDNNERMIQKCKQRVAQNGLSVDVRQANVEKNLPFGDNAIDLILAESIIAFTDAERSIGELRRILKPDGRLLAIEVSKDGMLQPDEEKMICDFYGFTGLRTADDWRSILQAGGFSEIDITGSSIDFTSPDLEDGPDFRMDDDIETECFDMLSEHEYLTKSYQEELSYQIFRCK